MKDHMIFGPGSDRRGDGFGADSFCMKLRRQLRFGGTVGVHEELVLLSEKVSNSTTEAETESRARTAARKGRAGLWKEVPAALQKTVNVKQTPCGLQKSEVVSEPESI